MNNYKEKLEKKIEDCMKQYNLTDSDVGFGNAGQIKGYVMGLKAALEMFNEADIAKNATSTDEPVSRTISTRRRSR